MPKIAQETKNEKNKIKWNKQANNFIIKEYFFVEDGINKVVKAYIVYRY